MGAGCRTAFYLPRRKAQNPVRRPGPTRTDASCAGVFADRIFLFIPPLRLALFRKRAHAFFAVRASHYSAECCLEILEVLP